MNQTQAAKITVADILRLVLPLRTTVVGGDDTGRLAEWVTVLTELSEPSDLQDQIQAGDVVILPSGLQNQLDDSDLVSLVPVINDHSAAALLTFHPVPDVVARVAAGCQLPILVVLGDTTLREVHQDIASLLVDRHKQITERGMQLYRRLTEMSREGQGLAAMTAVMSRLTGKIVAVQDKRLELRALTIPDGSTIDDASVRSALRQQDRLPPLLLNRKAATNTPQGHWQQMLLLGDVKMARLISPIVSGDRARGYVSVIGPPDRIDLLDKLTAEQGAAACAMEMAKEKAISEARKALRGDFLEGLLTGSLPEDEIQRLAGRLDHDTGRPHAIMALAWDGDSRRENTPSLRRLETPMHWLLSDHDLPTLTHIYSDDHICVFLALRSDGEDLNAAVAVAEQLREHLQIEFPEERLLCGVSGPARTLSEWPETYRQAGQALHLARRLRPDRVVEYSKLGVYQLLTQLEEMPAARLFCHQMIAPVDDYDRGHNSSLVKTLDAYFNHHGNISQTADALYIHRNTLHYRLERIQELTGQDLDQAQMRLALHLALKLWQLLPDSNSAES